MSQFNPFEGSSYTPPLNRQTILPLRAMPVSFVKAGERPKVEEKKSKKNKKKGGSGTGRNGYSYGSSMKINPETGRMMDMSLDEDWSLCDKDCGWCGHCAEDILY